MPRAPRHPEAPPAFFATAVAEARRFYLDLTPPRRCPLTVVCGGREQCAPDYAIERTTFPYCSIEFVAAGRGTLQIRRRRHALAPGTLFCYARAIPHRIATDPSDPMVKYFVDFAGTRAAALLRSCRLAPGQVSQVLAPHEVQGVFDELIRNGLRATRQTPEICTKLLEYLALKILESLAPRPGAQTQAYATFLACREHIQKNFRRLRTLEQIAAECYLDPAYLCRLFRRYDHPTPYHYLLRLKMNLAADQLQQPGILVKQVSDEMGFTDPFHFSRVFKSVFGLSPDAFKRIR